MEEKLITRVVRHVNLHQTVLFDFILDLFMISRLTSELETDEKRVLWIRTCGDWQSYRFFSSSFYFDHLEHTSRFCIISYSNERPQVKPRMFLKTNSHGKVMSSNYSHIIDFLWRFKKNVWISNDFHSFIFNCDVPGDIEKLPDGCI